MVRRAVDGGQRRNPGRRNPPLTGNTSQQAPWNGPVTYLRTTAPARAIQCGWLPLLYCCIYPSRGRRRTTRTRKAGRRGGRVTQSRLMLGLGQFRLGSPCLRMCLVWECRGLLVRCVVPRRGVADTVFFLCLILLFSAFLFFFLSLFLISCFLCFFFSFFVFRFPFAPAPSSLGFCQDCFFCWQPPVFWVGATPNSIISGVRCYFPPASHRLQSARSAIFTHARTTNPCVKGRWIA